MCLSLLMINFVTTGSKFAAARDFHVHFDDIMTQFIIKKKTDKKLT